MGVHQEYLEQFSKGKIWKYSLLQAVLPRNRLDPEYLIKAILKEIERETLHLLRSYHPHNFQKIDKRLMHFRKTQFIKIKIPMNC